MTLFSILFRSFQVGLSESCTAFSLLLTKLFSQCNTGSWFGTIME